MAGSMRNGIRKRKSLFNAFITELVLPQVAILAAALAVVKYL